MTRVAAPFVAVLLSLPLIAGEVAPTSNIVGGLRRVSFLGAALSGGEGAVTIDAAVPGSTAEKMGLQHGDVVISVDGAPVSNAGGLIAAITKKRAGDAVAVVIRRGGETLTKEGRVAALPLESRAGYEIDYGNVDAGGAKRRVIVTRPRSAGKHPAVLMIGGIGCYSLDGLLRPAELRHPYAKILDALTRAGYVTMRVEKSGMRDSEGPPCSDPRSDFEAEVRGYSAGLKQLESEEDRCAGSHLLRDGRFRDRRLSGSLPARHDQRLPSGTCDLHRHRRHGPRPAAGRIAEGIAGRNDACAVLRSGSWTKRYASSTARGAARRDLKTS